MRWTSLTVLIMALTFTVGTARADDCASVELRAVGKKEFGLLNCQSKVAARNDSSHLDVCRSKVEAKLSRELAKAGCTGDEPKCAAAATNCESAMVTLLSDTFPSACEAAKRRAAGKLARRELHCYARAAAKGLAVDTACITKARDIFDAALAKAGTCPDGDAPRDAVEQSCVRRAVVTDCPGTVIEACPGLGAIPLCCESLGALCFGGSTTPGEAGRFEAGLFLSHCGRGGGSTHIGSTCVPAACPPEAPPGVACGTCQDVPFQTTTVCCQQGCTCFEQTVSTWSQLLNVPCNTPPSGSDHLVEGTCGTNGACVAAD
jgi:hypothetical protein